ncbi:MAG: AAA family ATPase [Caulobacter sp.]
MTDFPPLTLAFERETAFQFRSIGELKPVTRPYLIKGVLPARGVAFIAGASRAGKTFVALDAMMRLACGAPYCWKRQVNACGVLYIAAEDPDGVNNRALGWMKGAAQKAQWTPRDDPPFKLVTGKVNLLDPDNVADFLAGARLAREAFEAAGHRLGVVVLDTFSRGLPGVEENSSQQMSEAVAVLQDIERELDCLVLVVAHHGKSGGNSGIRGWSGIDAASDATITVTRSADDPHLRLIEFTKVKNGPDGGVLGFHLEEVHLGEDEDGEPINTCIVKLTNDKGAVAAKPRRVSLTAHEGVMLRAVNWLTDNGPHTAIPPSEQAGPAAKGVTRSDVRARALALGLCADLVGDDVVTAGADAAARAQGATRARIARAISGLVSKGKIRVSGDVLWLV